MNRPLAEKEFLNLSVIDLLLNAQKDFADFFVNSVTTKKLNIKSSIENRISTEEKTAYIISEIQTIRESLEGDLMNDIYGQFAQPLSALIPQLKNYEKNSRSISNMIPDESNDLQALIGKAFEKGSEISENDIATLILQVEKNGGKSNLLESVRKSKEPFDALLYIIFFVHFEKQYLQFLKTILEDLQTPTKEMNELLEKIEWQGTQKELGELFVELHKKGWIKEMNANLIERYFTKSDTIKQVLKPTKDKTGSNFDGIYTKAYKPKFADIKPKTQ